MLVISNPHYSLHAPRWEFKLGGETYSTKDLATRPELIRKALEGEGGFTFRDAEEFPPERIARLHGYHDFIKEVCAGITNPEEEIYPDLFPGEGAGIVRKNHPLWMGLFCTDAVTPLKKETYRTAKGSAEAAMTAARVVKDREHEAVYAMCRPSGHHAGPRNFGGYCYFNNCGLAAQVLLEEFPRVAILDIDFHHGNGTQELFYTRGDVYTTSIHCNPEIEYPYFTGYADEHGKEQGEGANLNMPLRKEADTAEYLAAIDSFAKAMEPFQPDALVIGAGYDTHEKDPIGAFRIPTGAYRKIGERLGGLRLPTVICQEGGYNLEVLGDCALNFLASFRDAHGRAG